MTASTLWCTRSRSSTASCSSPTAPCSPISAPRTCASPSPTRCTGESVELPIAPLDLAAVGELCFEPVDLEAFPCLRLAGDAAREGGTAPCVLNAANEIAVHAFLEGRLRFVEIPDVIERTLSELGSEPIRSFESLYEADRQARALAGDAVAGLA